MSENLEVDNFKKDWILFTKVACKNCGRSGIHSMTIKGSNSFRTCKCGWIIKMPK